MTVTMMNKKIATVFSFAEASAAITKEIDETGIGASDWQDHGAGLVRSDGEKIARVSYNGRVWDLLGFEIKEEA